jgi:hypothetical protein
MTSCHCCVVCLSYSAVPLESQTRAALMPLTAATAAAEAVVAAAAIVAVASVVAE